MSDIPKTSIHTSKSNSTAVDLCAGKSLLPVGSAPYGISKTASLLSTSGNVVHLLKYDVNAWASFQVGACGPAWATYMEVKGTADSSSAALTVSNEFTEVGLFIGGVISVSVTVSAWTWKVTLPKCHPKLPKCHWSGVHCHWHGWHLHCSGPHLHCHGGGLNCSGGFTGWTQILDVKATAAIDLAAVFAKALGLDKSALAAIPGVTSSVVMTAVGKNQLTATKGAAQYKPYYPLHINVIDEFKALAAGDKALADVGGALSVGPELSINLPTTITLTAVHTNKTKYDKLTWSGSKVTGTAAGSSTVGSTEVGLEFKQKTTIGLSLGVFVDVKAGKFFSLSAHKDEKDLADAKGGDNTVLLKSNLGAVASAAGTDDGDQGDGPLRMVDVIFDEPGSRSA